MKEQKLETEKLIAINGTKLYVEKTGQGDVILLIHAGVADRRMWDEQFDTFSKTHSVIRFDLRGFGDSRMSAGTFAHHQDVAGILSNFGVEKVVVIGASFGGYIAIDFALSYPELVEKLILVAPALGGHEFKSAEMLDFFEKEDGLLEDGGLDAATELNLKMWVDGPHRDAGEVDPKVREQVREMQRKIFAQPDVDDVEELAIVPTAISRLHKIEPPTLIISGELDVGEFQEISQLLGKKISNAKEITMTGVAHLPSMEKAEAFNRIVLDFVRDEG